MSPWNNLYELLRLMRTMNPHTVAPSDLRNFHHIILTHIKNDSAALESIDEDIAKNTTTIKEIAENPPEDPGELTDAKMVELTAIKSHVILL